MKKFNWNNIWVNLRLLLIFGLVVFLYAFTSKRNEARKTKKTIVEFVNNDALYVGYETVNKLLIENGQQLKTIGKDKVVLNDLEKILNDHDMIQKSEVFISIDGVLKAVVTQRTPIARVFSEKGSFYIDSKGNTMPLSAVQTARLPLVLGEISDKNRKEIFELLWFIYNDYEIEFGKTVEVVRKFDNYKAFFQKAVHDTLIDTYKIINLKFTQQVVCTK
jgi:cell division protein FtsQ